MTTQFEILGMPINRLPPEEFVEHFVSKAATGDAGYVCVPNVHQCMICYDEPEYMAVLKGADFVISDSTVLQRFVALKYKLPAMQVQRGDIMTLSLCRAAAERGIPVGLVGGKSDDVLARMAHALKEQVPDLMLVYAWSPPFRTLSVIEEKAMLEGIRASGARILFVGLGCPKQERWMANYTNRLPLMMIGVGAAFDFISGEVKTSADWVHGAGLEWLHRLVSEPARLGRRYISTSPRFLWLFFVKEWLMKLSR